MTVQQIHEYIWDHVIDEIKEGRPMIVIGEHTIKNEAIIMLEDEHLIDSQAADVLQQNNSCVLCALYKKCHQCPLYNGFGGCGFEESTYKKAYRGDLDAAERIKAINVLEGTDPEQAVIDDLEHVRCS